MNPSEEKVKQPKFCFICGSKLLIYSISEYFGYNNYWLYCSSKKCREVFNASIDDKNNRNVTHVKTLNKIP